MWMVNNNATSWVEYGKTEQKGIKAIHSQSGMIDVNPGAQKIVLTGLEPGTRYFYRVASSEVKLHQAYKVVYGDTLFSQTYSFTTSPASARQFSFLAFNDIHSKPEFMEDIVKREAGFSFAMMNGDILGDINAENDIAKYMLIPFSNYFASGKPFFLTRGNHETRGSGARNLSKYIDTPTGKYYYSFTYGNACFIVLDCGEDKPDENPAYFGLADYDNYRMDEAEWLALEVQKPEYKIVCIHMPVTLRPPEENIAGHGMADCSKKFAPVLNNAGVDLLLAGHTHKFAVIRPQKGVTRFPIIVGGAPVSGKDTEKTTYTLVEVGKSGITCFLKKVNGEVIGEVKIGKGKALR
jgi:UDP-2,3-diacylglucosamine pyrophosphatase LpxH